MSRSIIIEMERREGRTSRPLKFSDTVFVELRRKLARWANDVGDLSRFQLPLDAPVKRREFDNWESLYRVARGVSPGVAYQLVHYVPSFTNEEQDFATYLLESLRKLYREHDLMVQGGHLSSDMIVEALNQDKEAPWYHGKDSKGITREKLSSLLRRYKVKPEQHWHPDVAKVVRGYFYLNPNNPHNSLNRVFEAYLGPEK